MIPEILLIHSGDSITDANRAAWLEARRSSIGASEAPACLGLSGSPLEVYCRKLGLLDDEEETLPMRVGRHMEPLLERLYEERTGRTIARSQVYVRNDDPPYRYHSTLDAVCTDNTVVELKTVGLRNRAYLDRLGEEGTDEVPEAWLVQCHHTLGVVALDQMDLAVLIGNDDFRVYSIRRDECLAERIREAERELLDRILRRDPPPPIQPWDARLMAAVYPRAEGEIDFGEDDAREALCFEELGQALAKLERERVAHKLAVLEAMREAKVARLPDGRRIKRTVIVHEACTRDVKAYREVRITFTKGRNGYGQGK